MKLLKIEIIGNKASVFLLDEKRKVISKSAWIDKRDLSEKLLSKIDFLLKKNNLSIKDISKVDFNCDSPYFGKNKKINLEENSAPLESPIGTSARLSESLPTGQAGSAERLRYGGCGFTAWQTGEITAKILKLACLKLALTKEEN